MQSFMNTLKTTGVYIVHCMVCELRFNKAVKKETERKRREGKRREERRGEEKEKESLLP